LNQIKSNPNVNYLGNLNNYKNIFYKIDCLISPSYTEGAGTSVMEAMMNGLYIIAYKNNGHNYVLRNTKNYVCKKNTVKELINGYEYFKKKTQNELFHNSKLSYQRVKINFSSKKISRQFEKILLDFPYKITHITRRFSNIHGGIEQVINNMQNFNLNIKQNVVSFGNHNHVKNLKNKNKSYIFKDNLSFAADPFSFKALNYFKNKNNNNIFFLHYPCILSSFYIIFYLRNNLIISIYHSDITKYIFIKPLVLFHLKILNIFVDKYYISSNLYLKISDIKNYYKKTLQEHFSIDIKNNYINKNYKTPYKKYVIFIAKDRHYKGFDYLKKIILLNQNINFVCITDHKINLKIKNLKVLSFINENFKKYLIKNSQIVISTSISKSESYGISLLEGLFYNKPLIAFNLQTGVNDIIKNNKNGILIKKFDIYKYSEALRKLYNNKNLNKKFSLYSNDHKKNFKSNYKKLFNYINQR
jgi:glycosyltransferase involved in cell wall biosynthesis